MKHFIDKANTMSRQVVDSAVILDSKGKKIGKIIVRYTDSQIGWNNETGIILHVPGVDLNFSKTVKGGCYDRGSIYTLLDSVGAKVFNFNGERITNYKAKQGEVDYGSMSRCSEYESIKVGNNKYRIVWV